MQLGAELKRLCASQMTGTLFIVTAQGASASVVLSRGRIVSLAYRNQFGKQALEHLQNLGDCKLSFKPGLLLRTDTEIPATVEILDALGGVHHALAASASGGRETTHILPLIEESMRAALAPVFGDKTAENLCRQQLAAATAPRNAAEIRELVKLSTALYLGKARAEQLSEQIIQAIETQAAQTAAPDTADFSDIPVTDYSDIVNVATVKQHASTEASRLFGADGPQLVNKKLTGLGLNTSIANIERALREIVAESGAAGKNTEFVSNVLKQLGRFGSQR